MMMKSSSSSSSSRSSWHSFVRQHVSWILPFILLMIFLSSRLNKVSTTSWSSFPQDKDTSNALEPSTSTRSQRRRSLFQLISMNPRRMTKQNNPKIEKQMRPVLFDSTIVDDTTTTKCLSFQNENKKKTRKDPVSIRKTSRIPKKIHIADYSSCPSNEKYQTIWNTWEQLKDFDVYFHSSHHMDALIRQDWPEFPHLLSIVDTCIPNFGSYLDLWKSLILWEFGGAVVDYGWLPTINFTTTLIRPADQAIVFPYPKEGLFSTIYLLEPKHPLAFYLVLHILHTIQSQSTLSDLIEQSPRPTGPVALGHAIMLFTMADQGIKYKDTGLYRVPEKGYNMTTYLGRYNRTIRLEDMRSFLSPSSLRKSKIHQYYHNSQAILPHEQQWNVSCMKRRLDCLLNYVPPLEESNH